MKKSVLNRLGFALLYVIITFYAIISLYPFFLTFITSLKPTIETTDLSIVWSHLSFRNYVRIFTEYPYLRWTANSLVFTLGVSIGSIYVNSLAGYALARLRFPGRQAMFWIILLMMMVPGTVFLVPRYIILAKLGWVNTYQGLIIPLVANCGFALMMRQFFLDIPLSLEEAAMVDGASRHTIFWEVAIPLVKPAIITMFIFNFIANWNEFMWPLLITKRPDMYTLPMGLQSFSSQYFQMTDLVHTGAMLLAIPAAILFIALQRYYIQGATAGAIKE